MSDVRLDRVGDAAVVTLDNPPVNALHPDVVAAIGSHVDEIAREPGIRCVVVTGGGRHFSAGGDIDFLRTLDRRSAEVYVLGVQTVQERLRLLPQPVIAAVNGSALGGGCELAMACDVRIAEEQAMFGQPEVRLGLIPGAGGTQQLARLLPAGRARRMLFTGVPVTAGEALALGLVDEVVAEGEALAAALRLADVIAANSGRAVAAAKRAVELGTQMALTDGLRLEASLFAELVETDETASAIDAFLDRRKSSR